MNIFNIACKREEARLVLLPVPWEVTTSFRGGTSRGPEAILEASAQVDLYDQETGQAWKNGYFWQKISTDLIEKNDLGRSLAKLIIEQFEKTGNLSEFQKELDQVNTLCAEMNEWTYHQAKLALKEKKLVGLVGGDHSTPLGLIRALSEEHQGNFGILHIDAHADLREAYEGFTYSHASIFYNVMTSSFAPKQLVQVGIRDFCLEEKKMIEQSDGPIQTFFDLDLKKQAHAGVSWKAQCKKIISALPEKVYVSFDIDGLDPKLCPNTGTPVPGGLQFDEALALFSELAESGRKIIGFDVNEVSPGEINGETNQAAIQPAIEWDAIVGSRVLFKLCGWAMITNGLPAYLA